MTDRKLTDLFGPEGATLSFKEPDKFEDIARNPESYRMLVAATRAVCRDWLKFLEGGTLDAIHPDVTVACARWNFIRCKYFKADYPRYMSYAFTPEQLATPGGNHGSFLDMLQDATTEQDDNKLYGITWLMAGKPSLIGLMAAQMPIADSRACLDFPVPTAAKFYDEYCPKGGAVLDPCHGWGGRYTGFLVAEKPRFYVGVDPSPVAHAGLEAIHEHLAPLAEPDKEAAFIFSPFEKAELDDFEFDVAFTSPPYNVEKYAGDQQTHVLYPEFPDFVRCFYRPMFEKVNHHLKLGGIFGLQVGSQQFPLRTTGMEIAQDIGLRMLTTEAHFVKRNPLHKTSDETGEVLMVFKKEA